MAVQYPKLVLLGWRMGASFLSGVGGTSVIDEDLPPWPRDDSHMHGEEADDDNVVVDRDRRGQPIGWMTTTRIFSGWERRMFVCCACDGMRALAVEGGEEVRREQPCRSG